MIICTNICVLAFCCLLLEVAETTLASFQINRVHGQRIFSHFGVDLILRRALSNASLQQLAVLGSLGDNAVMLHRHTLRRLELSVCSALVSEARDFFNRNEIILREQASWSFAHSVSNFDGTNSGVHGGKKYHTCMVDAEYNFGCLGTDTHESATLCIPPEGVTMPSSDVGLFGRF